MRLVHVEDITSDMELAKPIYQYDAVLLNKGNKELINYRKKLQKLGISYIYVNDSLAEDIEINDVIRDDTRLKAQSVIQNVFSDLTFDRKVNIKMVKDIVEEMLEEIFSNKNNIINMVKINSYDSYTFSHSVNVSVLALLMGKSLGLDRIKMSKLGTGALLHDIGKVLIPEKILSKPGKLTDSEFEIIKEHPKLGFEHLQSEMELSPLSRSVVLSHHERIDSTGYPHGMEGEGIPIFPRIVAIADVFDALTSNRVYRTRWPVHRAVDYLMAKAGTKFDNELITKFLRNIAVYPNGTKILLSNGEEAIVRSQNKNYPTRPVVDIIIENGVKKTKKTVDMLEKLDIVIKDVL